MSKEPWQEAGQPDYYDPHADREQAHMNILRELSASYPVNTKKASKEYATHYSIFVIPQLPRAYASSPELSIKQTLLLTDINPKNWSVVTKIREDHGLRVVVMADRIDRIQPEIYKGEPLIPVTTRRLLINRPTVLDFFLRATSELAASDRLLLNSLMEFVYSIDPDPSYIKQLHDSLMADFFPAGIKDNDSQISTTLEQSVTSAIDTIHTPPLYTILQATHPAQLSEVAQLMEQLDPRANKEGRQQDWASIMDGKQTVLIAYSYEAMKESAISGYGSTPILGYIATSSLVSTHPRLISIVTAPDERRRGLATTLVKRFFAHTAVRQLIVTVPKNINGREPFHLCTWFKKLGAELDKDTASSWRFILSNMHSR